MRNPFHLKTLSHHAYLLIGNDSLKDELILSLAHDHGVAIQGNPDFFERKYQNFTIDDSRELKAAHEMMPITAAGKKVFIISLNGITVEAQNALLKLLEEPAEYAHFFLIIPSAHLLLPTVRSRLSLINTTASDSNTPSAANSNKSKSVVATKLASFSKAGERDMSSDDLSKVTKIFVTSSISKRLEIVKKLVEDISKEKKSKQDAVEFLDTLQAYIYENNGPMDGKVSLDAIETARKYASDRSPSLKMLLEYVALNV